MGKRDYGADEICVPLITQLLARIRCHFRERRTILSRERDKLSRFMLVATHIRRWHGRCIMFGVRAERPGKENLKGERK